MWYLSYARRRAYGVFTPPFPPSAPPTVPPPTTTRTTYDHCTTPHACAHPLATVPAAHEAAASTPPPGPPFSVSAPAQNSAPPPPTSPKPPFSPPSQSHVPGSYPQRLKPPPAPGQPKKREPAGTPRFDLIRIASVWVEEIQEQESMGLPGCLPHPSRKKGLQGYI